MSGKSLRGPAPSLADACQPAPETAWVYLLRYNSNFTASGDTGQY